MSDTIHSATLRITGDSSEAVAAIAQVEKRVDNLATHATSAGRAASDGVKQIGSGAAEGAKGIDSATNSAVNAIQRATAAQNAGKESSIAYAVELSKLKGVNQTALEPHIATFNASTRAMIKAREEARLLNGTMSQTGMSAKQTAFAMRGIPAQMTDIVVSLQGGQKPLTVLMQQGGQLKDMFGGIGPAARAMGTHIASIAPMLIHPFTLAAAAVAAYGYAIYAAAEQHQKLTQALVSTGRFTGKTQSETQSLAEEVGKLTGKYGDAQEAAERLTASGKITGEQLKTAMLGVVNGAAVTGKSIEDMVAKFTEIADKPTEAAFEMNKQFGFLTVAQYEQIKALEETGRKQEAATKFFEAYANSHNSRRGEIQENLGYIMQAWKDIKAGIGAATVALVNFGRKQTDVEERKRAQSTLDSMVASGNTELSGEIANSKAYIAQLDAKIAKENADASATSASTIANKKKIDAVEDLDKYLKSKRHGTKDFLLEEEDKAFAKATANVEKSSADYVKALAAHAQAKEKINKQFEKKGANKVDPFDRGEMSFGREIAGIEFAIKNFDRFDGRVQASKEAMAEFDVSKFGKFSDEMRKKAKLPVLTAEQKADYIAEGRHLDEVVDKLRRVNVVKEFGKQINDFYYDETKHRDGLVFELQMLDKTAVEVAKLTEARRIDLSVQDRIQKAKEQIGEKNAGELAAKIAELKDAAEKAKAKSIEVIQAQYDRQRDPWAQMTDSIRKYGEEASNVGKQIGDAMTNAFKGAEDMLTNFVMTGKMDFKSFANSVIADLVRIQIRAMLSGSTSWLGNLFGLGGGTASVSTSGVTSNMSGFTTPLYSAGIPGYASGTDYFKGGLRLVGERGPELEATGPSRIFNANQTRDILSGASGGRAVQITHSPVFHIGDRVDKAEVHAIASRAAQNANAQLLDTMRREGLIAA